MSTAVIFDVDGTLVDSVDLHARAWREAFLHFGVDVPFPEVRGQIGKGGDQLMPVFLSPEQLDRFGAELSDFRSDLYKREYMPLVRPFPEARDLLARLREIGKPVALASSAKGDEARHYVDLLGADDLLDAVTTQTDVERTKPYPDVFEAALDRLGIAPSHGVVVVGDSPFDIEAAMKAGTSAVAVLCGGFPEDDLRAAGARAVYADPADLLARLEDSFLLRR